MTPKQQADCEKQFKKRFVRVSSSLEERGQQSPYIDHKFCFDIGYQAALESEGVEKLIEALKESMEQHKYLCESGDAGFWDLEDDTGYTICKKALAAWEKE